MRNAVFSIVIPCHNEADNIPLILNGFAQIMNRDDIEVILVDNGSTDDTPNILKQSQEQYKFLQVAHEPRPGYGQAILAGLSAACGEFIGWTHGDLQCPPGDMIRALDIFEKQAEPQKIYVKGRRKGRPFVDVLFTSGMSMFESILFGKRLVDINAQPNVFHRSFFENWDDPPTDFSLDLYAFCMAYKKGLTVCRFPVEFNPRIHGESHWNTGIRQKYKFIKRTLRFSFELKKRLN